MLHRYVCDALEEMRKAVEGLNYITLPIAKRHLKSLVEEIQTAVNRMENHLQMRSEVEHYENRYRDLKQQIEKLRKERDLLNEELSKDDDDTRATKRRIDKLYEEIGLSEYD